MEFGYARVSTKDQNEQGQLSALRDFGIQDRNIYVDKQSGKDFVRGNYQKMLRKLKKDDTLVIKSIDRLGRNYDEILEQWRIITKEKQVAIVILDMPLLDTRQSRTLTGVVIADIVLQLLGYVAQTEREFIRQRQAEGIALAKANGVRRWKSRRNTTRFTGNGGKEPSPQGRRRGNLAFHIRHLSIWTKNARS